MMLPKDISALLALELNIPDVVNLCLTNKKFNREICTNDNFWRNKLRFDFPQEEFKETRELTKSCSSETCETDKSFRDKYIKLYNDYPNFFIHISGRKVGEAYLNLRNLLNISKSKTVTAFDSPMFIKPQYTQFFREADFGNVGEKYGGSSINEILEPLLKYNMLSKSLQISLFLLYMKKNEFLEGDEKYYKADALMNKYMDDIMTDLEKRQFNRNKFTDLGYGAIANKMNALKREQTVGQKLLLENKKEYFGDLLILINSILREIR